MWAASILFILVVVAAVDQNPVAAQSETCKPDFGCIALCGESATNCDTTGPTPICSCCPMLSDPESQGCVVGGDCADSCGSGTIPFTCNVSGFPEFCACFCDRAEQRHNFTFTKKNEMKFIAPSTPIVKEAGPCSPETTTMCSTVCSGNVTSCEEDSEESPKGLCACSCLDQDEVPIRPPGNCKEDDECKGRCGSEDGFLCTDEADPAKEVCACYCPVQQRAIPGVKPNACDMETTAKCANFCSGELENCGANPDDGNPASVCNCKCTAENGTTIDPPASCAPLNSCQMSCDKIGFGGVGFLCPGSADPAEQVCACYCADGKLREAGDQAEVEMDKEEPQQNLQGCGNK